jgi:Family of unknown function (DUF6526)
MTGSAPQTYASHRRFVPPYHFVTSAILLLNLVWALYQVFHAFGMGSVVNLLVAVALLLMFFHLRVFPLRAQDRIIRLEERLRLARLLPEDLRGRLDEISTGQLIALRFASDDEVVDLCRRVLKGELTGREEIKKEIRAWRPDHLRM